MSLLNHHVYFLIDAEGKICYVGRSHVPKVRWRIHQRSFKEPLMMLLAGEFSFEEAQAEELYQIKTLRPRLNTYLASGPSRLGMKNSDAHNDALSRGSAGRTIESRIAAAKKGWEDRIFVKWQKPHTDAVKRKISLILNGRNRAVMEWACRGNS